VRNGAIVKLTKNSGLEGEPQFSPAGNQVAYERPTNGWVPNGNALFVARTGENGSDVRRDIDRDVVDYQWSADGKALWLATLDGVHSVLWYQPVAGSARRIAMGGLELSSLGNVAHTGAVVFSASTPQHPSDIYVLTSPSATPVRVTHENGFLSNYALGRPTGLDWKGSNGFHEDGVLTYPPNFTRGKKFPLVLLIHGGPQSASTVGWNSRRQVFAGHGYLVFEPNYRGSTNLGDRYQSAIYMDAGAGPGRDVMAGVQAVRQLGIVDDSRIAVTGWSYGGYMTSWMIGHYHIWKAAMSGAAVNDYLYDYNIAFYVHTDEPYFKGSPWDPRYGSDWREQSPITYASAIRTPTLIMGDIGDNNVPITNSFEMYHALKDNGVPVEFVAYPVSGHFPGDPVRSEDVSRRWLAWLDKYLGGGPL
jgi:dipeptidyl aminopeptidase/acylaminoacyl peptidase